jgi:acyl-CoA thioester hydrolase
MGFTYADMEKMGIIMPVVDVHCRYLRPAKYDDLLTIKTMLKELPFIIKLNFFRKFIMKQMYCWHPQKLLCTLWKQKT